MEIVTRPCKFGQVLIGTEMNYLVALEICEDVEKCYRSFIARWSNGGCYLSDKTVDEKIIEKVLQAVDENIVDRNLPIRYLNGTWFQRQVWDGIRDIPEGATISYNDLASKIGRANSARAIGSACGINPIAIFVPCHRVVRADGTSQGFRWGLKLKQALLDREKI